MSEFNTWLQAVAAVGSAIAALAALSVAKSTLKFQKNSVLKRANIEQIIDLLRQLHYLKSLTNQSALGVSDDDFTNLIQHISQTKIGLSALESMISNDARVHVIKIRDAVGLLRENDVFVSDDGLPNLFLTQRLDEAVGALENIYHLEMGSA